MTTTQSGRVAADDDKPVPQGEQAGITALPSKKTDLAGERSTGLIVGVVAFAMAPFLVLVGLLTWGSSMWWHLTWSAGIIALVFYLVSGLGVTVGYHRYFTHGSFVAKRGLKIALAYAAGLSVQGSEFHWVADHRRHHAFSDREGDPHSPWVRVRDGKVIYDNWAPDESPLRLKRGKMVYDNLDTDSPFRHGPNILGLIKGFYYAHFGWLHDRDQTNTEKYIPDLLSDRDLVRVDRNFGWVLAFTLIAPALLNGLVTWSWQGIAVGFIWASVLRIALLHHVTWSTNSICHMLGDRPFRSRDKSANFWPLALMSFGESWHNLHHADPSCARHGVLRGQVDISAWVIKQFERLGWATNVRWPQPERIAKLIEAGSQQRSARQVSRLDRHIADKLATAPVSKRTRLEAWATQARADLASKLARRQARSLARNLARNGAIT